MTLDEYQKLASKTVNMKISDEMRIATFALGLSGEAGEVADMLKKHLGHGHNLRIDDLRKELGDVLWYVAALATVHGLDLSAIAQANIDKLKKRYPEGFSSERSKNRGEAASFFAGGVEVSGQPDHEDLDFTCQACRERAGTKR
jgi:hypothetical protein